MLAIKMSFVLSAILSLVMASIQGRRTIGMITESGMISGSGIASGPAEAGQVILVTWTLLKETDCPGVDSRVWSGPGGFYLVEDRKPTSLPRTTEPRTYVIPTRIPDLMPPGEAELSIVGEYKCDDGGSLNFTLGPVAITVLPPEKRGQK